ncbi:Suppressor of tumorigenicity 7 protein [Varanus komodoensis]|nr:Suppressor of tumorigenicity 7 protein [Varanus komodoensis]
MLKNKANKNIVIAMPNSDQTFHDVSVYPQKELPFFIHFTAGLCSFTAMLALLTHQFPELMVIFAKAFFGTLLSPLSFMMEKLERFMPAGLWHQLTQISSFLLRTADLSPSNRLCSHRSKEKERQPLLCRWAQTKPEWVAVAANEEENFERWLSECILLITPLKPNAYIANLRPHSEMSLII